MYSDIAARIVPLSSGTEWSTAKREWKLWKAWTEVDAKHSFCSVCGTAPATNQVVIHHPGANHKINIGYDCCGIQLELPGAMDQVFKAIHTGEPNDDALLKYIRARYPGLLAKHGNDSFLQSIVSHPEWTLTTGQVRKKHQVMGMIRKYFTRASKPCHGYLLTGLNTVWFAVGTNPEWSPDAPSSQAEAIAAGIVSMAKGGAANAALIESGLPLDPSYYRPAQEMWLPVGRSQSCDAFMNSETGEVVYMAPED
jgi:hypothetical protein